MLGKFGFIYLTHSRLSYSLALFLILAILLSPLAIDTVPALLDYPIHLARSYITIEYANDPILREIFEIDWRPIPNLASDIILLFLGQVFEIETAGRILLAICLVITILSVIVLHRVNFGSYGWWPFIAIIPAYHGALTAGFVNYSIGIALVPLFLAFSKILDRHSLILQICANSLFAMTLFFCHVISTGLFGIFLFGFKSRNFLRKSKKATCDVFVYLIVPFILPAILYINQSLSKVLERDSSFIFGLWDIESRIRGLFIPFMSGEYLIDYFSCAIFIIIFGFIFLSKKMVASFDFIVGIALALIFFLVLPGQMLDASFIADRLPAAIILVLIASTNPQHMKNSYAAFFAALVLIITAGRAASMMTSWTESSRYYDRLGKVAEKVKRGSAVMIVSPMKDLQEKGYSFWHDTRMYNPSWHFALLNIPTLQSLSVIPLTKRAVFSQLHFVWADKQILSLAKPYRDLDFGDGGDSTWGSEVISEREGPGRSRISDLVERFDYILVVYADHLSPKLRDEIESRSPLYVDKELILLKTPF